jgi:glycerol-3-phosphate dehydrogenase
VADLIVTCYGGGRNRRCAEEFVKAGGRKTFEQTEMELLNGQKLQGTLTVREVMEILHKDGTADKYPLFKSIHAIAFEGAPPESMLATLGVVFSPSLPPSPSPSPSPIAIRRHRARCLASAKVRRSRAP